MCTPNLWHLTINKQFNVFSFFLFISLFVFITSIYSIVKRDSKSLSYLRFVTRTESYRKLYSTILINKYNELNWMAWKERWGEKERKTFDAKRIYTFIGEMGWESISFLSFFFSSSLCSLFFSIESISFDSY